MRDDFHRKQKICWQIESDGSAVIQIVEKRHVEQKRNRRATLSQMLGCFVPMHTCISTGVFHFPNKRAAEIAADTVEKWMADNPEVMERVIFNVFKDEDKEYYEELIQ